MDIGVTELRANLSRWLQVVQQGDSIVVTDRGRPVARLSPVESTELIDHLTATGDLARPTAASRPDVRHITKPRPRSPLSDRVTEQRA